MELMNIIASNIQNLLDSRKVSVSEISQILNVSRQTMTNYLKAASVIDSVQLQTLAEYFNVDISSFYVQSNEKNSSLIFRTALNYSVADTLIHDSVINYLENYTSLATKVNKTYRFFPEQYNLYLNSFSNKIDINYECQDFFDSKLKINFELDSEILRIANEQRAILGLGDRGAISLIPALISKGINVIFYDFGNTEIFGLSLCDDVKGCYIFVNSNENISVERQLFTLAHEYGHIILHRPIYKRKLQLDSDVNTKSNLLDKMADRFAGYLLAPNYMLAPYSNQINEIKNDFISVCKFLLPLKLKFQVSLFSLLISFKNFGYIPNHIVNSFSKANGLEKKELNPIKDHSDLYTYFTHEKFATIHSMVQKGLINEELTEEEAKFNLKFFCNYKDEEIDQVICNLNTPADFSELIP